MQLLSEKEKLRKNFILTDLIYVKIGKETSRVGTDA